MKEVTGRLSGEGLRVGIVVSRFNDIVTERLLQGAVGALLRAGVREGDLTVVRVPGSFEIPFAAQRLASSGACDAIVCLGALIRGETDHYDHLASAVTGGIAQVSLKHDLPVTYGVITADTVEQALNRAGLKHGNKGAEAATGAVELADAARRLRE